MTSPKTQLKLVIAYFGAPFMGWQKTKMGPSIEEALEKALQQILQHEVKLQAASRTDAGVHAHRQVVSFIMQKPIDMYANDVKNRFHYSLNQLLPKEISVISMEMMPDDFHPTLSCSKKEYLYHICNSPLQMPFFRETSWHFPYPLNLAAMRDGAQHLLGTHDFSTFCNERQLWDRDPVCHMEKIDILSHSAGQRLGISITGDHFLYKMARNIAGTLAYIGCGKLIVSDIPTILSSKNRTLAGITAPAHGLVLKQVFYN